MNTLLKETVDKNIIIKDKKVELERLHSLVNEPTATNEAPQQGVSTTELEDTEMKVDATALNYVVENAIYKLVEPVTTPLGQRQASLMPPLLPTQQPLDTQGTQDSLSFLPINEIGQLRASNSN